MTEKLAPPRPDKCEVCGGDFRYGTGLYAYYRCGHAFEKPLNDKEKGKWVHYPSPYDKGEGRRC